MDQGFVVSRPVRHSGTGLLMGPTINARKLSTGSLLLAGVLALDMWSIGEWRVGDYSIAVASASAGVILVGLMGLVIGPHAPGHKWGLSSFHLGPWWIVKFIIIFGLTSLAWTSVQAALGNVEQADIVPGLLVAQVALFCFAVGYARGSSLLSSVLSNLVSWAIPTGRLYWSPFLAVWIYSIGALGRLIQIATGRFSYLENPFEAINAPSAIEQPLTMLASLARYGLILAALNRGLYPNPISKGIFRVLLVIELGFGLISGMKEEFLLTFLALLIIHSALTHRLPSKWVVLGLAAALALVPINLAYREYLRASGVVRAPGEAVKQLPSIIDAVFLHGPPLREIPGDSYQALRDRLREIDSIAVIVKETPRSIPYAGPLRAASSTIAGLVPRFLWPDKPATTYGYEFGRAYFGQQSFSSIAVTLPGDLYRYGGIGVVVVGMLMMGALSRSIDVATYPDQVFIKLLFYVPLFIAVTNLEADLVSFIGGLVHQFIVLLVVSRIIFGQKRGVSIQ